MNFVHICFGLKENSSQIITSRTDWTSAALTKHTRAVVGRLISQLEEKLSVHGLEGLLERRRGMCRLNLQVGPNDEELLS